MKLVASFLLLLPAFAMAQDFKCDKKVDEKKAVVFIDLNSSLLEVLAAQKAACERGETFIQIPRVTPEIKEFGAARLKKNMAREIFIKQCSKNGSLIESSECSNSAYELGILERQADTIYDKLENQLVDANLVTAELKKLSKNKVSITSVIMSGHNGGGSVSGILGDLDKHEFLTAFDEAYATKPQLKKNLQSCLLWGCYTSTPQEVMFWKEKLPDLKIIAGFSGSGPSNMREAGHNLIQDILVKEKSIVTSQEEEAIKNIIENLSGASETYIGMYAQCSEEKKEYYLSNEFNSLKFQRFDELKGCSEKQDVIVDIKSSFEKFYYGSEPIPEVTSSGPLREAYSGLRAYAHCLDQEALFNPDRAGLLLFSRGVQKNFLQTFSKEIKEFQKECDTVDTLLSPKIQIEAEDLKQSKVDLKIACGALKPFFSSPDVFLDRSNLSAIPSFLEAALGVDNDPDYKALRSALPHSVKMQKLVDRYLYKLDPECMDFLQWHEFKEGTMAEGRCQ